MLRLWFICGDWLSDFNHLTDASAHIYLCLMAPDLTWRPVDRGGGKLAYHEIFLQNFFDIGCQNLAQRPAET